MGYPHDPIQSRVGDGTQLGGRVTDWIEELLLGTAGAVKNAELFLNIFLSQSSN